jgi:hypothetical protein
VNSGCHPDTLSSVAARRACGRLAPHRVAQRCSRSKPLTHLLAWASPFRPATTHAPEASAMVDFGP